MSSKVFNYLSLTIEALLDIRDPEAIKSSDEVNNFINIPNTVNLLVSTNRDSLTFSNKLHNVDQVSLLFIKSRLTIVDDSNFKEVVDVHTIRDLSDINFEVNSKFIFNPLLLHSTNPNQNISRDDKIQNFSNISTLADELNYFDSNPSYSSIRNELDKIKDLVASKNDLTFDTFISKISNDVLDDIKFQYENHNCKERFSYLLVLITNEVFLFCYDKLKDIDIFSIVRNLNQNSDDDTTLRDVKKLLINSIKICDEWSSLELVQEQFKESNSLTYKYARRLEEVLTRFINIIEEILDVASDNDKSLLMNQSIYDGFKGVKPFTINSQNDSWKSSLEQFERKLDPILSNIISNIKDFFSEYLKSSQLLLEGFNKYRSLLKNSIVSKSLKSERETLLSLLKEELEFYRNIIENDSNSDIVSVILNLRQIRGKVADIRSQSKDILEDLPDYKSFIDNVKYIIKTVDSLQKSKYNDWVEKAKDIDIHFKKNILEFKDSILCVNFNEELVYFMREFRQLSELGFKAKGLDDIVTKAEKDYRYSIILKKISNFYNNFQDQIIDVQRGLLLYSIQKFQDFIKNEKKVSTDSPEFESYIRKLQIETEKVANENRSLRKIHDNLVSSSIALMNTDLYRKRKIWTSKFAVMNSKVKLIFDKYRKNSEEWITHWNNQLYKVLEIGYQNGLENIINDNVSEIKVDLVYSNKALQFNPSTEKIRYAIYKELKKFLGFPYSFKGFDYTNEVTLFSKMGNKNTKRLVKVFQKTEQVIASLSTLLQKYSEWTLLASLDIDATISKYVKTYDQFAVNFKMLRAKKKEIDKIPDIEKVDCISVSLIIFKTFLEDIFRKYNDTLLIYLRRSLIEEFKQVDEFLEFAREKLNSKPRSVEEISEAKIQWKNFVDQKPQMQKISNECVEKKKLLLQYAPGTSIDISEVLSKMSHLDGEGGRWDNFEISLEAHNEIIEKQKEVLRTYLEEEEIQIIKEIEKFNSKWIQLKPTEMKTMTNEDSIQKVFDALVDWRKQFAELEAMTNKHSESRVAFGMSSPKFDSLESLQNDINTTASSWDLLKSYMEEEKSIAGEDWITFNNVYVLQDFASKWIDELKQKFSRGSFDSIGEYIYNKAEEIKKSVPSLKYCKSDAFKEDHWTELLQGHLQLSKDVRFDNLKVSHFLTRLEILKKPTTLSFVKNLQARALGEVQIREAIHELRGWELSSELKFLTTEESGRPIPLIKEWKELFLEIGDKQSLLGSLKESPFFKAFADIGLALEAKMTSLDYILHTLNSIQRKWLYLEPIFSRGALPGEESRFKRIDESFKEIMSTMGKDPKLFYLCDESYYPKLSDNLRHMHDQLERCQKALTEFLEAKRSAMPRFYFIGDDDLLEILGQAKNPNVIQSHLKKLFQGINKVKFDSEFKQITAMVSSFGEVVEFESPIKVNEKVEDWLELLVQEMRATLSSLFIECYNSKKTNWNYPSQILCLARAVKFTQEAENAILNNTLKNLQRDLNDELREYTSHDLSSEPLIQIKMKSLVFDLVHYIDVVDQLISKDTSKLSDWQWSKQLRYYYEKSKGVFVCMHDAEFDYTYEYQGNAPKLVHTPLTDRCYLTLTQGMKMGFGGNPYGPAGTGKTESVKALAASLGRQVLVFNCDEALESTSMIRIFIGIVKCGAWGCFDEFNRLKEDQLSAISQQIQLIQDAIKTKTSPIPLLGRSIDVDFNSGIFVTLNPAGKGYGGRSRLPDNLKALFRPVAMGAPNNELIAEVSLITDGFSKSKDLASKIVSLFKLSKQLLSNQQHYDWGLRALKAVLNTAGRLIQQAKLTTSEVSAEIESEILIKAVRVNTLSKLTYADTLKFLALIGDIFPGVKSADISGGELEEAIREVLKEKPFYCVEDASQIKKMLQLKESLDQRMGCVVVGPSGCGKSTLWKVLKTAMIKCGYPVVTYVMNPKSMPRERLLGFMDIDTREWYDGVLTDAARKVVKESNDVRCWIICDGDVDPEWIESLNSVLDDNHLLTLPNGERISFGSNVNFLFETHDLKFASPATVSRMGMIFLSDDDLDISRIIQKWLSTFDNERRISLSSWIDEIFYKAFEYVMRCDLIVDTTTVGTVLNGLSQIKDATTKSEFVCGVIRGLGGNLSLLQRTQLAKEVFSWINERPPDIGQPLDCYADGNSYRAFVSDFESINDNEFAIHDIGNRYVLPTVSVQRTLSTIESWIKYHDPFILVGPEGCGKSMMINYAFRRKKNISIATLNCNAQTTSDDVIRKIAQTCSLYSSSDGRVYRPRDCERLVLYLKDINLPRPDMYETCQLIAFLQQIITFGGFYDENLEFLRLEKIQIVASINAATTVGRHVLSSRFTAVVRILVVDYPETQELISVYSKFLQTVLSSVPLSDSKWLQPSECERLARCIVEIYLKVRDKFTVDDYRHYLFTPRDMTSLVKNLSRYDLESENLLDIISVESIRIFRDRLVGQDSESKFDQILSGLLRTSFKHPLPSSQYFYSCLGDSISSSKKDSSDSKSSSSGTNYNVQDNVGKLFSRVSEEEFLKLVNQGIVYYEREERDLNMLLFLETLEMVSRVSRILSTNGGHLLMVGKSGIGRRNAATISTYMLRYTFFSPSITRDYGLKQFSNDVKSVLDIAGIKGEPVVLFMEDFQITCEPILELINSLISSGEAPGLYSHDELEPILNSLRRLMDDDDGIAKTPYEFFINRIRKNLHIVLCMDFRHPRFLYRCESNPALYSQCSVLWMEEWKIQSLKQIPILMDGVKDILVKSSSDEDTDSNSQGKHIDSGSDSKRDSKSSRRFDSKNEQEETSNSSEVNNNLLEMIISIHKSACDNLSSGPLDYLSFLKSWNSLYNLKKADLLKEIGHLEAGLSKLESAAEVVHDLRTNAAQQEKDLKVAQAAADRAMEDISKAISSSTSRRNEVGEIKRTVAENEEVTKKRKLQIEDELSEIQPVLESAKTAVGSIRSDHLNEIRSLSTPPEAIADVLAAVLTLLGMQDLSWQSMKKFLSNRGVKEEILNYDAKRMSAETRKNVAKILKKKAASFEDDNIKRVSVAAAPLAIWVKANIRYSMVIEKIEPLQQELDQEIYKLEQSQKNLKRCEDELLEIDEKVAQLKKDFGARTAEAERLKNNLSIAGTTLDKAEKLIAQLSGEQTRWKAQSSQLKSDLLNLPIKMLLAAGFSTYLPKTSEDVRSKMINIWQEILNFKSQFIFKRVMSTESELLQWKSMGLPTDDLSQENGLVISHSVNRTPFIIDPANAATDWLKYILSSNKNNPLEVVNQFDPRFLQQVELSVRFGKTLLILEADTLEPALYPLCRKDLRHQGPRNVVTIGEKTIDYNESFRLFIVTRNPYPEISPDASSLLNIVNFTVTRSGLEGQLLGIAIQNEQPELESAKGEMLKKEEDFKVQLAKMEKDLLEALATAEGNLLENTSLIESLSNTKKKSAEIEQALIKSAEASVKLDKEREVYRPFASSGANMFFIVKSLQSISHMYQFSLSSFISLFKQSLISPETKAKSTEERLTLLSSDLEVRTLYFIGRALFKSDRSMFAIHLVHGMHPEQFQPREWEVFTGAFVASVSDSIPKNFPSWAPTDRKDAFLLLQEQLPHLVSSLELDNTSKWTRFASSMEAEKDLPSFRGITSFQKVLIIQCFRPDRLQSAILQFCTEILRINSISPPPVSLPNLFEEINSTTPLLFITSPGADPSKELQEYAAKTIGIGNFDELPMGGGQQENAIHLLRSASQNGTWLCLKNLHLVVAWLPTLEKELASIQEPHRDFRLILTSESHDHFPNILLQQSFKSTFESPPGIKKNLQGIFEAWESMDYFDPNNPVRSRLLFLLAIFHAIVQERRTYIPQGWSKFYEFSYGDLKAGSYVIESVTKKLGNNALDWEVIHGLMEDAIYGGRIDNAFDVRVLRSYLNKFFCNRLVSDKSSNSEIIKHTSLIMPSNADFLSFKKIIDKLPDSDTPHMFNLPDNIERSLQRNLSSTLIRQLRLLASSSTEAAKYDREKWRVQLGPLLELWQQIVSNNQGIITKKSKSIGKNKESSSNPLENFINMEYELSSVICNSVDSSINSLKKILFGSGLLTPSIQALAISLLSDNIPTEWQQLGFSDDNGAPEKPAEWLREVVRKRLSLTKLYDRVKSGGSTSLLSSPLNLSDVFHPITFLNALRQLSARHLQVSIENLKLVCIWGSTSNKSTSSSDLLKKHLSYDISSVDNLPILTLSNLKLQGAIYNGQSLNEISPDNHESFSLLPDVSIAFVSSSTSGVYSPEKSISLPVYYTISERDQSILELSIPINEYEHDKWTLSGCALFLSEN